MNYAQLAVDAAQRFGDTNAWHYQGTWTSHRQLLEQGCRLASVLRDNGVRPGDRVVIAMHSCPDVPASFQAIARIGAVATPITPRLMPAEIAYILQHSEARLILTSSELAGRVSEAAGQTAVEPKILVFGNANESQAEDVSSQLAGAAPHESLHPAECDDLAMLVYTSGTTGTPKAVMLSHQNLVSNIHAFASTFDRPIDERTMLCLPLSHVYGMMLLNRSAIIGGVGAMLPWFDAGQALQTIESFGVQSCSMVPSMLFALINHPDRDHYDVSSLNYVSTGAAPLAESLRTEFERLFGCRVVEGYGLTEATCVLTSYRDDEAFVPGSVGRALSGVEIEIQDDDNRALKVGEHGEICARGNSIMLGYWKDDQATHTTIVNGWLHTGDIGYLDERGYLFIVDRKKDLIIKGGENVSPRAIEETLEKMPGVAEVAVFGIPDERFQEEIAAAVVVDPGARISAAQVHQFVAERIAPFRSPKQIVFVQALPRSSTGKVLKRQLKAEWNAI